MLSIIIQLHHNCFCQLTRPLPGPTELFVACICACSVMSHSFAAPWTVAHLAPLSMGFSRQEYWSGLPFPSPGDLSNPGNKPASPASPALQTDSLSLNPLGSPAKVSVTPWGLGRAPIPGERSSGTEGNLRHTLTSSARAAVLRGPQSASAELPDWVAPLLPDSSADTPPPYSTLLLRSTQDSRPPPLRG